MTTTTKTKRAPRRVRNCGCGCGGATRGGRFQPGHDAKLKGVLIKAARAGDQAAVEHLTKLGWLHFLTEGKPSRSKSIETATEPNNE